MQKTIKVKGWAIVDNNERVGMSIFRDQYFIFYFKEDAESFRENYDEEVKPCTITVKI